MFKLFGLLVVTMLGIATPLAYAPPPPPAPAGTIFYQHNSIIAMWTMNADGSNKTQLGFPTGGSVSNLQHAGYFWFVDGRPYIDEDQNQRLELFAYRSDFDQVNNNNSATKVQLTDDPLLSKSAGIPNWIDWVPGDAAVSFKGRRSEGGTIVEAGIYNVSLVYDSMGNLVGGASPTTTVLTFPLILDGAGNPAPDLREFDWGPTGTKLVYTDTSFRLWVADLVAGTQTIINNGIAQHPQWSPSGAKIVFGSGGHIYALNPSGSQLKRIISGNSTTNFNMPRWSPTSGFIIFYGVTAGNPDIYRAKDSGASVTNLTNTPNDPGTPFDEEIPWGWR